MEQLLAGRRTWQAECIQAGLFLPVPAVNSHPVPQGFEVMGTMTIDQLARAKYKGDPSPANGSSIAVLADYCGVRLLLAGDAASGGLDIQPATPDCPRGKAANQGIQAAASWQPE